MIARILARSPAKRVPVAMALVSSGLLLIVFSAVWTRLRFAAGLTPDTSDFVRGSLVGLALVLEMVGVYLAATVARSRKP